MHQEQRKARRKRENKWERERQTDRQVSTNKQIKYHQFLVCTYRLSSQWVEQLVKMRSTELSGTHCL